MIFRCEADDEVLYVEVKKPEEVPHIIERYFGDANFSVYDVRLVTQLQFVPEGKEILR